MATPKNDLWKLLDTRTKQSRLTGLIEKHLQARPVGDRDYTVLHPSEIIKADHCWRASYFLLSGHKRIAEKPGLRLQSIFDEGHFIHEKWQRWFQEAGVLYGNYKCQVCDKMTWGLSPANCEHCGAPEYKLFYSEVTMRDDSVRIKGHTDGWVKDAVGDTLIEIKSIGTGTLRADAPDLLREYDNDLSKAFRNIKRPFPSHLMQGQMYLELMKRMGHEVEGIVFIYELKQDQDYKEFPIVKADFELVQHVFEKSAKVVADVEAGIAPACNNDPENGCKQCQPYKED